MVDCCPPSKFASYYSEPNWLWGLVGFTNIYSLDVSFECCCSNITWKKDMGISTFTLLLATRSSTYIHSRRRAFKFIEVTLNWNTHTHTQKTLGLRQRVWNTTETGDWTCHKIIYKTSRSLTTKTLWARKYAHVIIYSLQITILNCKHQL